MSSAENFTQSVRRYGLHKQIAHWSMHGKTYNKTCTKRRISLHTLSLHIRSLIRAFANRMYLLQSLGLTKYLVLRAKTRINLPTAHSDKSIRWSYLPSIAGLSKAGQTVRLQQHILIRPFADHTVCTFFGLGYPRSLLYLVGRCRDWSESLLSHVHCSIVHFVWFSERTL